MYYNDAQTIENEQFAMHDILLPAAAFCYLAATLVLYRSLLGAGDQQRRLAVGLALAGAAIHLAAQTLHWVPLGGQSISFLNVMSSCALVSILMLLGSLAFRNSLFDAGLVAFPLAAAVLLGEWAFDLPGNLLENASVTTAIHVISSVMAFGLLSLAGIYALFIALIDHFLRQHHLNRLVRALPSLETLERLLFRLIGTGFSLLTLSLLTGLLFVTDMFAQHLAHKTILAILAWLVFGLLLWGRYVRGWRGSTAVRLTIAGVILLLLSYFGSKYILEVVLDQSWSL